MEISKHFVFEYLLDNELEVKVRIDGQGQKWEISLFCPFKHDILVLR